MITKFQIFEQSENYLFESNGNKRLFYHATKPEYLPEILKHGLTPNIDRKTNWGDELGKWSKGKIFVTDELSNAILYGKMINYTSFSPILRVWVDKNKLTFDEDSGSDWYSKETINGDFEIKIDDVWVKLTMELAEKIMDELNYKISEGLISTFSTKKTVKILKRKFPDYYISILPDGEIEISAGRKEHVSDNIKDIFMICNQLGWYISHGNIDYSPYEFNKDEFFEMSFDDIVLKPIFDSTRNIDIKPSILYYITPVKNVDKILKIGLTPKPKVNLTDELELAWGMKKELERTTKQECEILKILANDLDIKLYSDIDSRRFGYYTFENIPPKFISILPKEDYRKHWLV